MKDDCFVFNIKEVSKLVGVSPATIRNWEKYGLIIPERNSNNYRAYSFEDIERLKKIKNLSINEHLNISSIKSMLDLTDANHSAHPNLDSDNQVSVKHSKKLMLNKWKQCREDSNYTLEEVSRQTGISVSYLSKIENGGANISLEIVNKLSNFYGESIVYFYEDGEDEDAETFVVSKEDREVVDMGNPNVHIESLINNRTSIMKSSIVTIMPGGGVHESHRHKGEDCIFILEGRLKIVLNDKDEYFINCGDSMYFKTSDSHNWENPGNEVTKLIWTHNPITR
ncbi:MAG: MerR family transcriptional regulator [Clostridioides sp.]|jgi:DNA-binding transcriptional MerR regulator/mannose-6-phosphate isomerase-like protein (cupin superfamily)|nr:MerR family transcriptional regulator [Clostridioides sp.]